MIKLAQDTISQQHLNQLSDWLRSGPEQLTQGPIVAKFEAEFASKIGARYSIMVNSGSSALLLMFAALIERGICKFNKKIVIPALSWSTDYSSSKLLGLEPILVDCNLDNLSVNLVHLEKIFKEESPSTLLLVSILGLPPDMREIQELCKKYHVVLVEDVCESYGSKYNGRNLGTFGTMSCFSLYWGHHLSTIEAGMICTDSEEYYNLLVMLRSHGWMRNCTSSKKKELKQKYNISDFESLYTFFLAGFNVRSTEINAFLGLLQLEVADEYVRIRNNNYLQWQEELNQFKNIWKPKYKSRDFVSSFALPVISKNRNLVVQSCIENNIEVRPLVAGSLTEQPMVYRQQQINRKNFTNAIKVHNFGCYMPNHQSISPNDVNKMASIVRKFCAQE